MDDARSEPIEVAPGLWSWSRRHPEWHPGDFGAEVVSFLARAADRTLLLDPLLDGEDDPSWGLIEREAAETVHVLISIPYHVRSAELIRNRFAPDLQVMIHGHPACARRLASPDGFESFAAGDELPAGVTAHRIGKPRRQETPLHLPSHDAILFGDALVGTDDGPRVWSMKRVDERVGRFYAERFAPTLEPLLELRPKRLLMTHGPSFLDDGTELLGEALTSPPWYHRG